jgi:hypothetical protein
MGLRPSIANKYLNWKQVIDHVTGVVLVMLVRLNVAIGTFCAGQQCVLTRLLRRNPIKLPTSLRVPLNRIYEFCLGPGLATVSAYRYLRHFGLPLQSSIPFDTLRSAVQPAPSHLLRVVLDQHSLVYLPAWDSSYFHGFAWER